MQGKRLPLLFFPFLCLMIVPLVVQATETIAVCTLDKGIYHQGEAGYVTVTIYNDRESKIRLTELACRIDYYYTDENVYSQSFVTNAALPAEIQEGQSGIFCIPFSLPTNIASGYTDISVRAQTDRWNPVMEKWFPSEHLTSEATLHIESPYKGQLDEQVMINEQLRAHNKSTTNTMYLLGTTTVVFAAVMVFLFILNRRARVNAQP